MCECVNVDGLMRVPIAKIRRRGGGEQVGAQPRPAPRPPDKLGVRVKDGLTRGNIDWKESLGIGLGQTGTRVIGTRVQNNPSARYAIYYRRTQMKRAVDDRHGTRR